MMLQPDHPEDYVIGSGETHSVREFCEQAFSSLGLDYQDYVVQDKRFYRPVEEEIPISDPSKAHRQLGWYPQVGFTDLVKMMVVAEQERLSRPGAI